MTLASTTTWGHKKKRRSLLDKDARLYETLVRMCVQVVWLALGRKSFNQIGSLLLYPRGLYGRVVGTCIEQELEINRLFKSDVFNAAEHTLKTGYMAKMEREERMVLMGECVRPAHKLTTHSPLADEVFCARNFDYRSLALGVLNLPNITSRLDYMLTAIGSPEEELRKKSVFVGILGAERSLYDTMLRPIPIQTTESSRSKISVLRVVSSHKFTTTAAAAVVTKLFPDIVLPTKQEADLLRILIVVIVCTRGVHYKVRMESKWGLWNDKKSKYWLVKLKYSLDLKKRAEETKISTFKDTFDDEKIIRLLAPECLSMLKNKPG
ncbi:hypothetical protein EVAR_14873_1 [Eumeta japonica]|uniref:Uncharacterized protein n=1 Tax=Eumeta variegata TaxID=151549 RepID=A0A4C1V4I1_EUMVA|nr:hypothetical protein EVAR_14873_1 [Eumeta japonica]